MKEITIIALLWVIAVLAISGWQTFVSGFAKSQIDRQNEIYNEGLRKALSE